MAKEKRPMWWKMFNHQRAVIESVSDADAGAGLKAAFRYFDGEDIPTDTMTPQTFIAFCVIRPYIDEAFRDYEESVEKGKEGARRRWGKNSPPMPPLSPPMGVLREEKRGEETEETSISNSPLRELDIEVKKDEKKYPDDMELVQGEDGKQAWKKKE